jgi:hypothetical protein
LAALADQADVRLLVLGELLEEGLGAGMGDGAEVLHQLVVGHADASVGDRERARRFVGGERDGRG